MTNHRHPSNPGWTADDEAERIFDAKVCQYVADPGFDGTVRQYLATMVAEYEEQDRNASPTGRVPNLIAAQVRGKRDAYRDALRVLDDAIDAAARFGTWDEYVR